MNKLLRWLGKNKLIAVMLTVALYFSIVTFHDEVTQVAIGIRNSMGIDSFNDLLAWSFLILLLLFITYIAFDIYRSPQKAWSMSLAAGMTILMVLSFRWLMVYNIEAIHFVEYMMVAILIFPVLKSYGETVFWVTILGILDEIFQYRFLTPEYEYFDFNDCLLNLIGAGTGMVFIYISAGDARRVRRMKWYRSPAVITGLGLLAAFIILWLTGKMTVDPAPAGAENWFSLNRQALPDAFWKEAYPGRSYHVLRAYEGILLMYILFAFFFLLDHISIRKLKKQAE
jgi:hypothetical protein